MKKYLVWFMVLILSMGLLTGCGGKSAAREDAAYGVVLDGVGNSNEEYSQEIGTSLSGSTVSDTQVAASTQKLVRKVRLEAETEDMDALLEAISKKISQLGGYVEQQEVYNGSQYASRRYRNAEMTIRIPAHKLGEFVGQVEAEANVVSSSESAEDITLSYVATQSRITALETEQTRLLELLAKAETTKDLLEIEQRLTKVRTELEEITSQLRLYDNLVDYGTVNLSISEVKEYTVVEEPETVWQRIGTGFMQSLKSIGAGFTEIFVFAIANLPYLVLLAIAVAVVLVIIRLAGKKKKTTKE